MLKAAIETYVVGCYPRNALAGWDEVRPAFRGSTGGLPAGQLRKGIDGRLPYSQRSQLRELAELLAVDFRELEPHSVLGEQHVVLG